MSLIDPKNIVDITDRRPFAARPLAPPGVVQYAISLESAGRLKRAVDSLLGQPVMLRNSDMDARRAEAMIDSVIGPDFFSRVRFDTEARSASVTFYEAPARYKPGREVQFVATEELEAEVRR